MTADTPPTPLGFCRAGEARGRYVSGVDESSIQTLIDLGEDDPDFLWGLRWWFEPGIGIPGQYEYEENLTRTESLVRLREWNVEWLDAPSTAAESFVFDPEQWQAWKRGWRNRRRMGNPSAALEFATWSYLTQANSSPRPMKVRTAQGACTLIRDLLAGDDEKPVGRTAKDILDARIGLPRVVVSAGINGLGLAVVPRVGCLFRGATPDAEVFSSGSAEQLAETIRGTVRGADDHYEDNYALFNFAPRWARRRMQGRGDDFLSLVISLARTDHCLALIPLGADCINVELPADPWAEFRQAAASWQWNQIP